MSTTVLYFNGPMHGEVETRDFAVIDASLTIEMGTVTYRRVERADTPGRIAYAFENDTTLDPRCAAGEHEVQNTAAGMHSWCLRPGCDWHHDYD
jgi:hypothetical protein